MADTPSATTEAPTGEKVPVEIRHWLRGHVIFRAEVDALPGYRARDTGRVFTLDEAFGAVPPPAPGRRRAPAARG